MNGHSKPQAFVNSKRSLLGLLLAVFTVLAFGLPGIAQAVTINLRAAETTVTMPDGVSVPIWGFALCAGPCTGAEVPTAPGPVLEAVAGQPLTVNVLNDVPEAISFMVPGLEVAPLLGVIGDTTAKPSFMATVGNGNSGSFTIGADTVNRPLRPGTFLYESGSDQSKQVQMGLFGALIVRPADYVASDPATHTAYGLGTGTDYYSEQVLVLSEIDPAWHLAAQSGAPYNAVYFTPKYWLFNGKAYPDNLDMLSKVGQKVLLRYVHAGSQDHVVVTQGLTQTLLGDDGYPMSFPRMTHSVSIHPGETKDTVVTPTAAGVFPVFDRALDITNVNHFPGGMITMMRVLDAADTGFILVTNTAPAQVLAGQTYTFDFMAVDADNLDGTLTYALTSAPAGMVIDAATGRITWPTPDGTPHLVTVAVTSTNANGVSTTQPFDINLQLAVNTPPSFSAGMLDETVNAATAFTRSVVAVDPDAGDTVTYTLVGPPAGMTINPSTGVINWTVTGSPEGTYTLPVMVHINDNHGASFENAFRLTVLSPIVVDPGAGPASTSTEVTINVQEVNPDNSLGVPVGDFKFLITTDNTHYRDPATGDCSVFRHGQMITNGSTMVAGQPHNPCISSEYVAANFPVVYAGDAVNGENNVVALPDGRYFVSVLTTPLGALGGDPGQAGRDGGRHKQDGKSFEVGGLNGVTSVTVGVVPDPLPVSRLTLQIFEDSHPLNAQWDQQFEGPPTRNGVVERFRVFLEDNLGGQVTEDIHGNPLCSEYSMAADPVTGVVPAWPGNPIAGTGGVCYTDANGFVSIENLARGKYGVFAIPPDGVDWIQTTTIEGGKVNDVWAIEGNRGVWPAETNALTIHGFARPCASGECPSGGALGTGTFFGQVTKVAPARPPFVIQDGATDPVDRPWVALNLISGNGEMVAMVRGNKQGVFEINNVPDGMYQLVVLDDQLDYITAIFTATMPNLIKNPDSTYTENRVVQVFDPRFAQGTFKPLPIPDWWHQLHGTIFLDSNEDGIQNDGEPGLPGEAVDVFHKDGSPQYATVTDENGNYNLRRFFPFASWLVPAVGYARLGVTGAHVIAGEHLTSIGQPAVEDTVHKGQVLTIGNFPLEGGVNAISWGKKPYPLNGVPAEGVPAASNGGISGLVIYATTRNELDAKKAAADPWEPGVAGVTLKLYETLIDPTTGQLVTGPDGAARQGRLLGTVTTDNYNDSPPTDCPLDPSYAGLNLPGLDTVDGVLVDTQCGETLRSWNSIRPALFDGGWQFFEDCRDNSDPNFPNAILPQGDPGCVSLAEGKYLVELVPPPFYHIVTENDVNVATQGDNFTANPFPQPTGVLAGLLAPSGCVGPDYEVVDPSHPNFGKKVNACTMKMVEISAGANAGTEFHLFTDVTIPARIRGFVNDNLNLESNRARTQFGDKAGIPNMPVSVRDFRGREIARFYTDDNGFFEGALPSNQTVTIPMPSGMAPAVYDVFANDPGTPENPDSFFNPNYDTLQMTFEFYPGKVSFADMAMTPVNGFLATQNVVCTGDATVPKVGSVSQPFGSQADTITVYGSDFGTSGSVSIGGVILPVGDVGWSDTTITVSLAAAPVGPGQLVVRRTNGKASISGMTIHVTGAGYTPDFTTVVAAPNDPTPVQTAIDAASANAQISANPQVVLVPGTLAAPSIHRERVIVYNDVQLQGYGPDVSRIDASFMIPEERNAWLAKLTQVENSGLVDVNTQHPLLQLFSTVLVINTANGAGVRVDGLTISGGRLGGGVHIATFADNTVISNNLIENNFGRMTGGIGVGFPNWNDNLISGTKIHHNRLVRNGTLVAAGGVGVYGGVPDYEVRDNLFCANGSGTGGGGMLHRTRNSGGAVISGNEFLFNWSFKDAGGLMVQGPNLGAGIASPGSGPVDISGNRFQGNISTEDGSAMAIVRTANDPVRLENNIVVNNVALAQGAIKVQDSLNTVLINNTVANNASTSTAGTVLFDQSTHSAGLVVYRNTALFQTVGAPMHSDPALYNNIFWDNTAYEWVPDLANQLGGNLVAAGVFDASLYLTPGALSEVSNNMFSFPGLDPLPFSTGTLNQIGANPEFKLPYDYALLGKLVRSAGEVAVHPLAVPVVVTIDELLVPQGDYHVKNVSPALQYGASQFAGGAVAAPSVDVDGDTRPAQACYDAGADEVNLATLPQTCIEAVVGGGATPISGEEGIPVHFDGSGFAGTSYAWDFGDGTTGTGAQLDKIFANSGQYIVTLTVDAVSQANFIANIANRNPVVTLNGGLDAAGVVGTPLALLGTALDPSPTDQTSLTYVWNWDVLGTGVTTQTLTPSAVHNFAAVGTFQVSLTATDVDGGTASATINVVVTPAPVGALVPGDIDGDGDVDIDDYNLLVSLMGKTSADPGFIAAADMSGNGIIDMADFQLWMAL